ncbi:MAG: MarR family transcriptional regulator [Deltaproteobacteria bacterium]|nr:MarR family transcriptional regulator [Deltaproteobacteria bacterium]
MTLRPQDVVVALVIALRPEERWSFPAIAKSAGLSLSEAHAAVKRAVQARLVAQPQGGSGALAPMRENLLEFLVHGVGYAFPAEHGGVTRGMPTAHSAPVLASEMSGSSEAPCVWPDPEGRARGEALRPLYRTVPRAARNDPRLYDALALVDALRAGNARERTLAAKLLRKLISGRKR